MGHLGHDAHLYYNSDETDVRTIPWFFGGVILRMFTSGGFNVSLSGER